MGAVPYGIAHLLFWLHSRGGDVMAGSLDLVIAQLLFLLGTLLLARVTHMLNEPITPDGVRDAQDAARCLAVTVALAFSPGIWWLFTLN